MIAFLQFFSRKISTLCFFCIYILNYHIKISIAFFLFLIAFFTFTFCIYLFIKYISIFAYAFPLFALLAFTGQKFFHFGFIETFKAGIPYSTTFAKNKVYKKADTFMYKISATKRLRLKFFFYKTSKKYFFRLVLKCRANLP